MINEGIMSTRLGSPYRAGYFHLPSRHRRGATTEHQYSSASMMVMTRSVTGVGRVGRVRA